MKVAAFLPAKGSSVRIPNKNTMLLDGEPMFLRGLKKLLGSSRIDEVWLDTDSQEIIDLAADLDCRFLRRDPTLASNRTDGNSLFANEVSRTDADLYVQHLCTSPFLRIDSIERAIDVLETHSEYDSVVAVRREKQYTWRDGRPGYDHARIPNSSDLPDTVVEAMGLYVARREAVRRTGRRIGDNPYLLEVDPMESIDVNWPADFELANLIAVGIRERERRLLQNLRVMLSSSLLSDVMDDLGIEGVLSGGFGANIAGAKIIGRAKTLEIGLCAEDDDFRKIYDSLNLYDHVVSNDVIVIANKVPNSAFFGELNANLAIRAGASGAIIDGVTRDTRETADIGFPVFSRGTSCRDTRRRGIVTSKNRTVVIDGVSIHRDDLVFADQDGVAVIPRRHEREIIDMALDKVRNERLILVDIAKGAPTGELVEKYGLF